MKKVIVLLAATIVFASCNKKQNPQLIEGEVLKVTTEINPLAPINGVRFFAEIDAKQDAVKEKTIEVEITWKLANDFTSTASAGYQPFFVRITRNSEGKYEFKELALMNYDVMGSQPWYQFQSDKKIIGN